MFRGIFFFLGRCNVLGESLPAKAENINLLYWFIFDKLVSEAVADLDEFLYPRYPCNV